MISHRNKGPVIKIERGAQDRLLPKGFADILMNRYFPVLSLTYIASVAGIAFQKGDFIHYMVADKSAYAMALIPSLWVSVPAVLWIILKGSHLFNHVADEWYKITAGIMMLTLIISYVLLPEAEMFGLRVCFAATIPIMFIMYVLFVKGGLPPAAANPLTAAGLTFLFYGAAINYIY